MHRLLALSSLSCLMLLLLVIFAVAAAFGADGATPVASFTYSPSAPVTGHVVTFDGSSSTCANTPCTYVWSDDGPDGPGGKNWPLGTGQVLTFTFDDAGTKYVRLTVTDALGQTSTTEQDVTVASSPQPPVAPTNTGLPVISGTPQQGQTLAASSGSWTGSPTGYTYAWSDGAQGVSDTLAAADVGQIISVTVTATNAGGSTPATSAGVGPVTAAPPPTAPVNTALPTITGTAQQGQTLSARTGSWTNSPTRYTYQWQDDGTTNIEGATSSNYTATAGDVGHTLDVVVTATNAGGSTTATSVSTARVTGRSGQQVNCANQPSVCGYPDATNSGVPAGTQLTPQSGRIHVTTAGTVISNLDLTAGIEISANNVTVKDTRITESSNFNQGAITIDSRVTGTVIEDTTLQGANSGSGSLFAGVMNNSGDQLTMLRDYGQYVDDILHGSGTIQDSYSIDNANIANDHYEPVADNGGNGALTINHDTLLNPHDQTAAVFTQCTFGDVSALTIENSLMAGGGYVVYGPLSDPCSNGGGPESVTGNRFSRIYFPNGGRYGVDAYFPDNTTWSGNIWDDTGASVPF